MRKRSRGCLLRSKTSMTAPWREGLTNILKSNDIYIMIYISFQDIMEATMQVSKWGNSLAVRLPKKLVEELGLKEGDELNVVAAKDGAIAIETREDQRSREL